MRLLPLTIPSVAHVARHMRAVDRREIIATRFSDDLDDLTYQAVHYSNHGVVAARGEVPVAAMGAAHMWPGAFAVWMFATDEWPSVAFGLTRWVRREFMPILLARGHRAECRSIIDHHVAHRWLESLGFVREAVMPDVGRNRETFVQFAWRISDHPDAFVSKRQ